MFMAMIYLAVGLALLYFGAEGLVRGASSLALRLGVSPLLVGLTVVAFGTSAPEMVVSLKAALTGSVDISLGNVVGSNICNIGLILGLAALIRPLVIKIELVRIQVPIMILASVITIVMLFDGAIGRIEGAALFVCFIGFVVFNVVKARKNSISSDVLPSVSGRLFLTIIFIVAGLVLLIIGAGVFVRGAVTLARMLHVTEAVIGLTIVAFGTSLPELATSVVAAIKGESDLAAGNVVGSNIFNILAILGITAIIHPLNAGEISLATLLIMGFSAFIILPLFRTGYILSRLEGGLILLFYCCYIGWLGLLGKG